MKIWKCPLCYAVIEGKKSELPFFIKWHIHKHERQINEAQELIQKLSYIAFHEQLGKLDTSDT